MSSNTHNKSYSRIYSIWRGMVQRTTGKQKNFQDYTKRNGGIPVYINPKWLKFENFYSEMGEDNGLSLDRINNDKGYFKENCRWTTRAIQATNVRPYGKYSLGVRKNSKKWIAKINFEGKSYHIGTFETEKLASLAYQSCKFALYGIT